MTELPENKIIVCDLDGTLAPSKSPLTQSMSQTLDKLLPVHKLAVISGGSFRQFKKQFLSNLDIPTASLSNLYLFPVNGSTCYVFDGELNSWKQLYDDTFTREERDHIIKVLNESIAESGVELGEAFGERIEDRGEQITFSGLGQNAPLDLKKDWDPNQEKRQKIVSILSTKLSDFTVTIGGATSIDITHKGIDKAYAIEKIEQILHISKEDIVFIGDALYPNGNDHAAIKTGVFCLSVSGPEETEKVLHTYLEKLIN